MVIGYAALMGSMCAMLQLEFERKKTPNQFDDYLGYVCCTNGIFTPPHFQLKFANAAPPFIPSKLLLRDKEIILFKRDYHYFASSNVARTPSNHIIIENLLCKMMAYRFTHLNPIPSSN